MVNNTSGSITLDDKKRLELNYSTDDLIKDTTGKILLNLYHKHIVRTIHGLQINIDNDTIRYDSNESKLKSSIDKYLGLFGQINLGDIYLDSNKKMRLNINNYADDHPLSTIIMNTQNKISVNITEQALGENYLDSSNTLKLRLGPIFYTNSSEHLYLNINEDHALNLGK